jgi:hypothetical protein
MLILYHEFLSLAILAEVIYLTIGTKYGLVSIVMTAEQLETQPFYNFYANMDRPWVTGDFVSDVPAVTGEERVTLLHQICSGGDLRAAIDTDLEQYPDRAALLAELSANSPEAIDTYIAMDGEERAGLDTMLNLWWSAVVGEHLAQTSTAERGIPPWQDLLVMSLTVGNEDEAYNGYLNAMTPAERHLYISWGESSLRHLRAMSSNFPSVCEKPDSHPGHTESYMQEYKGLSELERTYYDRWLGEALVLTALFSTLETASGTPNAEPSIQHPTEALYALWRHTGEDQSSIWRQYTFQFTRAYSLFADAWNHPEMEEAGLLELYRSVAGEPADLEDYLEDATPAMFELGRLQAKFRLRKASDEARLAVSTNEINTQN